MPCHLGYPWTVQSIAECSLAFRALHEDKFTRNIENKNGTDCVLEVGGNETAESLLACGVPELEPAGGALVGDVLPDEVDADGGLLKGMRTFYFS